MHILLFPRLVPSGIINLVFLADADTKQGQIVFEGGYYLACSRICVSFPHKTCLPSWNKHENMHAVGVVRVLFKGGYYFLLITAIMRILYSRAGIIRCAVLFKEIL